VLTRHGDRLRFQIDADPPSSLRGFDLRGEAIDNLLVDDNRENPVLKAVGEEDVAKTRADDGADAYLLQRPHRSLT